jgi:hypothetical protein
MRVFQHDLSKESGRTDDRYHGRESVEASVTRQLQRAAWEAVQEIR